MNRRTVIKSAFAGIGVATADISADHTTKGAMTLRENPHGRKVSLLGYGAMRLPTVDGGHANACGATLYKIEEEDALLAECDALLKEYKKTHTGWM